MRGRKNKEERAHTHLKKGNNSLTDMMRVLHQRATQRKTVKIEPTTREEKGSTKTIRPLQSLAFFLSVLWGLSLAQRTRQIRPRTSGPNFSPRFLARNSRGILIGMFLFLTRARVENSLDASRPKWHVIDI